MDELKGLFQGEFGTPPGELDPNAARAIELRSEGESESVRPTDLEDVREEAQGLATSEEELLLLALFGEEAEPLLATIRGRASGEEGLVGGSVDQGRAERIREIVRIVQESGVAEIAVEEGGMRVSVRRREEGETPAVPAPSAPTETDVAPTPVVEPETDGLVRVEAPMSARLPRFVAGRAALRRGGRRGRGGSDALHPRGDEADERDQGGWTASSADPRGERSAGRIRQVLFEIEAALERPLDAVVNLDQDL